MPIQGAEIMTLTKQEIFDTVVTHLRKQGEKSISDSTRSCRYRMKKNGRNLACAAGCLIPDECYQESMEGTTIRHTLVKNIFTQIVGDDNIELLYDLQIAHDQNDVSMWEQRLAGVADEYHLTFTPLTEDQK